MKNSAVSKILFFMLILAVTVFAMPVLAQCQGAKPACQEVQTKPACAASCQEAPKPCNNPTPCGATTSSNVVYQPYTLEPKPEEFKMSARQEIFEGQSTDSSGGNTILADGSCTRVGKGGGIFESGSCQRNDKNGSIFGGRPCENCDKNGSILGGEPCDGPACKVVKKNPKAIQNYVVFDDDLYKSVHRECKDFAPVQMDWVDFRIKDGMDDQTYSKKLGKYRFRIFGCRRYDKDAILNAGRIVEKDMRFNEIFNDMVSDCYNTVKVPNDLCLNETSPLPEYVLTAEITDYYMNVCDGYDWDKVERENKRNGSAEMTVTWRLMDVTKSNVLWKGTSIGYSELTDGEQNGEMVLIERSFADAVDNLRQQSGFEDQLAIRVSPEEMQRQRQALIDLQRINNPAKCQFEVVEKSGVVSSGYGISESMSVEVKDSKGMVIIENSGSMSGGSGGTGSLIVESDSSTSIMVTENSGSMSAGSGTIIAGESSELLEVGAVDPNTGFMSATFEKDKLCILERPAYPNMGAENVYRVRSSIVSVANTNGKKGAGLLISDQFVMTSADLVDRNNNVYYLETINGKKLKAKAIRVNVKKNTALLALDEPTEYTPLSLNLELPPVGKGSFLTLGMMNLQDGEGYLENNGKVSGYRYGEDNTAEIVIDTFVQNVTVGGALIDEKGRITGISHSAKAGENSPDLFLPMETAMKSLGVEICGKAFPVQKPLPPKTWRKPVSEYIEAPVAKTPEVMKKKERK